MKRVFWTFSIFILAWAAFALYMKVSGPSKPYNEKLDKIPSLVWEGGAKPLNVHIETIGPAKLTAHLTRHKPSGQPERTVAATESLAAGSHDYKIMVPPRTGAYFQVDLDATQANPMLNWTIDYGGKSLYQHSGQVSDSIDIPDVTADGALKSSL